MEPSIALKHSSITLYTSKIPLIHLRQALGFLFYLEQRTRKERSSSIGFLLVVV